MCRCHAAHTCPAFYSSSPQSGLAASKRDIRWTEAFPRRRPGRPACRPSARRSRSMPGRSGRRDSGAAKANGPSRSSAVRSAVTSFDAADQRPEQSPERLAAYPPSRYCRLSENSTEPCAAGQRFHERNCTRTISNVKLRVDERVQIHLLHRHKPGASTWTQPLPGTCDLWTQWTF
jgi:hypothetical protein